MQMSLGFSDAEIRRLRDHEVLLTHVGNTTFSDGEGQASMERIQAKFTMLTAKNIPNMKSVHGLRKVSGDLKAAKMALATKEDAEPVLRLAKLMGLIGGNFSGSTLDVFILASQQAGARDFAQVQAVSLPEASPPPPASESAMTASAPADILPTVVETPQLPRRHESCSDVRQQLTNHDVLRYCSSKCCTLGVVVSTFCRSGTRASAAFIEPVRCAKTQPQDEGSPKPCGRLHKAQELRHKAAPRGSHLRGHKGCARPGDGHAEESAALREDWCHFGLLIDHDPKDTRRIGDVARGCNEAE
jgi:hypothetical protein